jgi:DNA polymerase/3'-5' exonuclease PolX
VLIPGKGCQGRLALALQALGRVIKSGPKLHSCWYRGQQVDIYIASEQTWWTLVLIRTGSRDHNIKMCSQARSMGMTLHANGSGLTRDNGTLIQPSSEEDIFTCVKLPYKQPEERG